ncbi:MAG TPA: cupin domain-containing protein [bacterium]|nr:cupin domain-containing protein [bacterium]
MDDKLKYQKDAIVSKEILNKKSGTITLFAFDKNQSLSEHTAPFDAFIYVVDGSVDITIARETNTLKKGQMIIIPANKPHSLKAIARFRMLLVMIRS